MSAQGDTWSTVSVVMITRNRRQEAVRSVARLMGLTDVRQVVVADNGSTDGTLASLGRSFNDVLVLDAGQNLEAAGRTLGMRYATSAYVAFADDDSGWAPGSLSRGVQLFEQYPKLGLVQGKILVNDQRRPDPTCLLMKTALPPVRQAPGVPITGFLACGAMVRKEAYLSVGGFHPRIGLGGEEALLAIDLLVAGWDVQYVEALVAYHWPSPLRDRFQRAVSEQRNDLWTCWLRRQPASIASQTWDCLRAALLGDRLCRYALVAALGGLGWVTRQRKRIPSEVEEMLKTCEGTATCPL